MIFENDQKRSIMDNKNSKININDVQRTENEQHTNMQTRACLHEFEIYDRYTKY
jgi:hypothetical protein